MPHTHTDQDLSSHTPVPQPSRHLRWDALPVDQPMPLLSRTRVIGTNAMISRVVLQKGCFVPRHVHANEQIACVMSGQLKFEVGTPGEASHRAVLVGAGELLHLPANLPHSALAVVDTVVLDIFSPPSEKTGIDQH
jgi:quercetin dioxygenase-like cupin family protein